MAGGEPASFAAKDPTVSIRRRGYAAASVRFGRKLADAFGYWIGALALFGAWRLRRRRATAGDRFAQVFFVLFSLAAIQFSAAEGYLVPRHLLPLVVAGIASAGFGAVELAPRRAASAAIVVLAGIACLPQTWMHLHDSRVGHRAAGEWLGTQAEFPGAVLDTQGWTGLYSGRGTYPYENAPAALRDPHLAYVVLQRGEFDRQSARSRTLRWLIETAG